MPIGGAAKAASAPAGYIPLQGATVAIGSLSSTTNADGYYLLTGVPEGKQPLTIVKDGYAPITRTVSVAANQTTVATAQDSTTGLLAPASSGSISVVSTPASATIFIDSAPTGLLTPQTLSGLAIGIHTVHVSLEGYLPAATQTVTVVNGETVDATFTLSPLACSTDADCGDGNDYTLDSCSAPGTAGSSCAHAAIACLTDIDCNDDNIMTLDSCVDPGTAQASCANDTISCNVNTDCADSNPLTLDTCSSPGTIQSSCAHAAIVCLADADCADGNNYTLDTCSNPGTAQAACANDPILCIADADCNDANTLTLDTCANPDALNASCNHTPIACNSDADCDDGSAITLDSCSNAGTAQAACANDPILCLADADCDDANTLTLDTCANPGALNASCNHTPIACNSDADCDDGNNYTLDTCSNPGTAQAACSHVLENTVPRALAFNPADGAVDVPWEQPSFKVIFSESMDTAVSPSGFSITLQREDTGGVFTISDTNASNYGSFSWTTTTVTNDTLAYTLKPNSTLEADGLMTLKPGTRYNITSRTDPSNLTDLDGNPLDATGIPSTGYFDTRPLLELTAPLTPLVYNEGEAIEVGWQAVGLTNLTLYVNSSAFEKRLIAGDLENDPDGAFSWSIPYADYRLYNYFNLSLEGVDRNGRIIASGASANLTLNNNPPPGVNNDFSKIFDIMNEAYIYYGGTASCGVHAAKMYEIALSFGFSPRQFGGFVEGDTSDNHVWMEVYVDSLQRWVIFDPTFNLYYTSNGAPASGLELHTALVTGMVDTLGHVKYDESIIRYDQYYINTFFTFKNICFVLYNPNESLSKVFYNDSYSTPPTWCQYSFPTNVFSMFYTESSKISLTDSYARFTTPAGLPTYYFSNYPSNTVFNAAQYINSQAYILNNYYRNRFFEAAEYIPGGGFESDGDGDGLADGWTATGLASAELLGNDMISGSRSQRLQFGPGGGAVSYAFSSVLPAELPYYQIFGFYKLVSGSARLTIPPYVSSSCASGNLLPLSLGGTTGDWNFLHTCSFFLMSSGDNIITIEADPNTVILLDEFHLLKNKK